MATATWSGVDGSMVLHALPIRDMTDEEFFEFCQRNRDHRIEQTAQGDIIVMSPTGWDTGDRNAEITMSILLQDTSSPTVRRDRPMPPGSPMKM